MSMTDFLMYAFYTALAVVFVYVSVVHRDRPGTAGSDVDADDDYQPRRGYVSEIRARQRISVR